MGRLVLRLVEAGVGDAADAVVRLAVFGGVGALQARLDDGGIIRGSGKRARDEQRELTDCQSPKRQPRSR
jgi:hypothetical protein